MRMQKSGELRTAVDAHLEALVVNLLGQSVDAVWETRLVDGNVAIDTARLFGPAVVDWQS